MPVEVPVGGVGERLAALVGPSSSNPGSATT